MDLTGDSSHIESWEMPRIRENIRVFDQKNSIIIYVQPIRYLSTGYEENAANPRSKTLQ